ncbi:hypothetical protein M3Y99_01792200 [Aphelenchoides fujianensis]|nr:hypothetical protein M3Y99_01792200 [Aphelenchoides fujianensis]
MEEDEDSTCTTSLSGGSERKKRKEFRQEIDAPPAYSLAAFCTKRNTKWNPTLLVVAAGISAVLACLVIGGLLFEVGRLNAAIAGQKAENEGLRRLCEVKKAALKAGRQAAGPNEDASTVEVQECWARVANVTKELVGHKERNRVATAEIARLEAEAVASQAELNASTSRTKKLEEEKIVLNGRIKQLESELRGAQNGTSSIPAVNLASNLTVTNDSATADDENCSYLCLYVRWLESGRKEPRTKDFDIGDTILFMFVTLFLLLLALVVALFVLFCLVGGSLCAYEWGCDHYKQRPPPPRFWVGSFFAVAVPILLVVLFFYGAAGLRDLINTCFNFNYRIRSIKRPLSNRRPLSIKRPPSSPSEK